MAPSPKTEPSLQIIAATNVAVSLWNHIGGISNASWEEPTKSIYQVTYLHSQVRLSVEKISLPKSVKKLIEKCLEEIYVEIENWLYYHYKPIYFKDKSLGYSLIRNFMHFVWYHDCTINYKQTARNLQNSILLNEVEKFRFLCLYCLKDEIEQKWKIVVQNKAIGSVTFDNRYPLIHYWRYYCLNRLQDVPVTEGLSIDEFMFRHSKVNNWPAKEYFFDRMNVDEQIRNAIWMIDEQSKPKYQKLVIMKLNQSQRYAIYESRSVEILLNYATESAYFDEIFPQWLEMAEMMNEEDFVKILDGLIFSEIPNHIVAQILISAPDKLKLRALNYKNETFVQKVWNSWMQLYGNSFRMLLEMSSSIRTEIVETKIFSDHCKLLLKERKFSILEQILRYCFSKDEELASMKRKLSLIEFFTENWKNCVQYDELLALRHLFNFFSDVINWDEFKQDFISKASFKNDCEELIQRGRLSQLDKLLNFFSTPEQTKKSWRDFFGETFFISCSENLIFSHRISVLDEFLNFFHFTAEESAQFKRDFISKQLFSDRCQELIKQNKLSKLEEILKPLFPCIDELVRFKADFSRRKGVLDRCEYLIRYDKLTELDELLRFLLPNDDESLEFKRMFAKKKFFDAVCDELIRIGAFSELEILLKLFYPKAEELVQCKQRLTRKTIFVQDCRSYIIYGCLENIKNLFNSCVFTSVEDVAQFKKNFAKKELFIACQELINSNEFSMVDDFLKLFFSSVKESTSFKKILLAKNSFLTHCITLISCDHFSILDELLKWSFPKKRDLKQFKNQLAECSYMKKRCLHLYSTGNFEKLDNMLSSLFLPRFELIYAVKRNLLLSKEGFEISLKLIEKSKNVLDDFICECLPTSTPSANFKKEIIFSPVAISHLKKLMLKNVLSDMKIYLNRFLTSTEDRNSLKMKLLDNAVEFFVMLFFKSDKFTCQNKIKWWLPDKTTIEECKQKLSVDEVFEAGIKTCIFETFDPRGRVTRCSFKKDFNFESLDRFLKWYFESSKEVKEFKIRKIRDYESMKTISVLVKNGCRYFYFKQLLEWFFENDAAEMAKFKKKHKGEKIASMINIVNESYSKRRRTL